MRALVYFLSAGLLFRRQRRAGQMSVFEQIEVGVKPETRCLP